MSDSASRKTRAKNLVIVESPTKAGTIHKFLGKDFQVEASYGHVRDLPKSTMGVDIQSNFTPQYIIPLKSRKTVNKLIKQAEGKSTILLAADPDREGEAICWHLATLFKDTGAQIKRVEYNELTKEAVCHAFENPREINENLVNAQQARRVLDRIVGYELSPLLWKKVQRGLSAGRVQSVALRLIVEREREIRNFKPVEYWTLNAILSSQKSGEQQKKFLARLDRIGKEKAELHNEQETLAVKNLLEKSDFKVIAIQKKERRRKAQAPYTTSKLQQEAYTRLGFSAIKTMKIAQQLYEGVELGNEGSVGLITYMRTDSVNVAASAQTETADYLRGKFGKDYLPAEPPVYKSRKGAQEAHEAIRPTSVKRDPESLRSFLNDDEFKLYDLIWRKFLASQMVPAVDENISVSILAGDKYFFKSTGRRNIFPGFDLAFTGFRSENPETQNGKNGDKEPEEDENVLDAGELPQLTAGEILKLHELLGFQHFTKPPSRYNDASLVKVLEEKGIGRPSTYAPTIYTLLYREYVTRKGGALVPAELGEIVADLLVQHFPKVVDVLFTARMEEELDKIEDGELNWIAVLKDFYGPFEADVAAAKDEMKNIRREAVPTEYVCDICGKQLLIKWGRFGKFLACSGFPDCKYTRSIPTGFVCPLEGCGGELVKRMSKQRRTFYGCSNYPKCNYITNKLPKQGEDLNEDDKLTDADRETLGP